MINDNVSYLGQAVEKKREQNLKNWAPHLIKACMEISMYFTQSIQF